jgi:signal peptidase I
MEEKKNVIKEILEWGYCIIIAVILALLVRYFLGTPTLVQQQSMQTTFMPGDRLILSRLINLRIQNIPKQENYYQTPCFWI